jgi:hypothetical protein
MRIPLQGLAGLLQQLPRLVLLLPRTDQWISCTVQIGWSAKQDYKNYMYYSWMDFTYKFDRTTVTVGAPSMLAISRSPVFAGTSS